MSGCGAEGDDLKPGTEYKAFNIEGQKYFAGSVLIMKYDGKRISLLTREEMEEAESVFTSRLVIMTGNGQDFSAYEI